MEKNQRLSLSSIFKIMITIFGLITIIIGYQVFQLWKIRHSWIPTTGIVTQTSSRGWWDKKKQWRYYLRYQYKVKGQTYTNVRFHIKERSIKKYTYLLNQFQNGDSIIVWYNPKYPAQSVINTEYLRNMFIFITVFLGFIIFAETIILKEKKWEQKAQKLKEAMGRYYTGDKPLNSSKILNDQKGVLILNTGMSIVWSLGIPVFFFSFLSSLSMAIFLDEINFGWTLCDYLSLTTISWICSLIICFVIKKGFVHTLKINSLNKTITETAVTFFKPNKQEYSFSDINRIRLYRDVWRPTNFSKNWILFLETYSHESIFVSFRHKDIQPAIGYYLHLLKLRIAYLLRTANE